MLCEPAANEDVVKEATPPESVPAPRSAVPSRKFTVPVGVPAVEVTVAVKITGFCSIDGLLLLAKVEADAALVTVSGAIPG